MRLPADRHARGHEQRGARYGIVVQSDRFALLSTVALVPTSRAALPRRFRPTVEVLGAQTQALPEQIRVLDRSRLAAPVDRLSPPQMADVDDALTLVFGLRRT